MPSKGRPRSQEARTAVLTAAAELLRADGYESLTIGGIAELAGVGRQTVYRWWASKAAIITEAVLAGVISMPVPPAPPSWGAGPDGSTPDGAVPGLGAWLASFGEAVTRDDTASVVRALAAAAAEGGADSEEIYALYTGPGKATIVDIATASGASAADAAVLADAVQGALLVSALTRRPVDAAYLESLGRLGFAPR
jgi:hypothetical protein